MPVLQGDCRHTNAAWGIPFSGMQFSYGAAPDRDAFSTGHSCPEQVSQGEWACRKHICENWRQSHEIKCTDVTRPAGSSGSPCGRWRRRWCGLCLSGIGFSSPDLQFVAGACMGAGLFLQFWGSVGAWDWRFCFCMLSVYLRPVPMQDAASPCRLPPLAQACCRHTICREE